MPPMAGRPGPLQAARVVARRVGLAALDGDVVQHAAGAGERDARWVPGGPRGRSTSTAQPPAAQSGAPAVVSVTGRRSTSGRVTT